VIMLDVIMLVLMIHVLLLSDALQILVTLLLDVLLKLFLVMMPVLSMPVMIILVVVKPLLTVTIIMIVLFTLAYTPLTCAYRDSTYGCQYETVDFDDSNACTTDTCDPYSTASSPCEYEPVF